ncbi:MAG: ABC transporter permease [Betaproteobacteria bacterium]
MNVHALELLYLLVRKDLKVRYKSSVLGYLWALAHPFAFALVYWLAFKYIMRVQMENYSLYIITGIFPWLWLASGVTHATRSYQVNASLVKKVRMPRAVLPLSNIVQEMAHFLFALPVIIAFLVFAGGFDLRASWLWQLPLMLTLQLAFVYPLALVFAISNVYVHDIEHLAGLAFAMLFFLTPMVYPVTMIPPELRPWFEWNPLHALMDSWRGVFLSGALDGAKVAYAAACAGAFAALAWICHRRLGPRIPELL